MPKRTRPPIHSRKADKAVARPEGPGTERRKLPLQKLGSPKATNGEGKTGLTAQAATRRLAEGISRAQDLRRQGLTLGEELQRQRDVTREVRAKCLRHIRRLRVRKEYLSCEDFGWYGALYSLLYRGIEITLLNFDFALHLQECMRVAEIFESVFTMVPNCHSRTVHFVRYFGSSKPSLA